MLCKQGCHIASLSFPALTSLIPSTVLGHGLPLAFGAVPATSHTLAAPVDLRGIKLGNRYDPILQVVRRISWWASYQESNCLGDA
jgi:hypothetical protein